MLSLLSRNYSHGALKQYLGDS